MSDQSIGEQTSDETLESYASLGRQLAAQMAEETFRVVTATPGWTSAHIEEAIEIAIERMDIASRDALAGKRADSSGEDWQTIWVAMETSYRDTMAVLLKASGYRSGEVLQ